MAEAYLKRLLSQGGPMDVRAHSAGVHAIDGNVTPEEGVETASHIGYRLDSHRARHLDADMADEADRIVVMAPEHAEFIRSTFPETEDKIEFLARYLIGNDDDTIPDPLGGSAFHYRNSYAQIAQAVQAFYDKTFPRKGSAAVDAPSTGPDEVADTASSEGQASPERRERVRVLVPASAANLGPGYDTLGIALQLYNRITLEPAGRDEIRVFGEGQASLPRDTTNIVFQAVETAFRQSKKERPPLRLTLDNTIPLARGLGSSAAARVGGLIAARTWCGLADDPDEVLRQAEALEGHADNAAPSLLGGLTIVAGREESLRFARAPISEKIQISLAIPEFEVSTPEARKALPKAVPHEHAVFNVQRTALLMAALAEGDESLLPTATQDRLHQPQRTHLMGPIQDAFNAARKSGAAGVTLSGAGPTVIAFSITEQADPRAIAEAMADVYQAQGIGCKPLTPEIDVRGAQANRLSGLSET